MCEEFHLKHLSSSSTLTAVVLPAGTSCTAQRSAVHCLPTLTCALRWLNPTNLIVHTAWLLTTVMPVPAQRPFCYSLRPPGTCQLHTSARQYKYIFDNKTITYLRESQHICKRAFRFLCWVRIFILVRTWGGSMWLKIHHYNLKLDFALLLFYWVQENKCRCFKTVWSTTKIYPLSVVHIQGPGS